MNSPTAPPPQFTECVTSRDGETSPADPRQMAKRLQELIEKIQSQPDPAGRNLLQDCLQSLLAFYGEGLARIMKHMENAGPAGQGILDQMLEDPTISGLLLIHGLHPVPLEKRFHSALEKVRPYMQSHGGNIELLSLADDVARVRLEGTCKSCPSSTITLELAVRKAVEDACPDLLGFEVENAAPENAPETAAVP